MFGCRLVVLFAVFLINANAFAYAPLNTDYAATVAKGSNQIEQYFFLISEYSPAANPEDGVSTGENYEGTGLARGFPLVYARGLTDSLDASFSPTFYATPSGGFSPIGNYTFAMKWRYLGDGERGLNAALKPMLILPATVDQQIYGLGNSALNAGLTAIFSYYWQSLELHVNTSYFRAPYDPNYQVGFSSDAKRTNLYAVSVAPVWQLAPQFKVALDLGVNTNPNEPDSSMTTYAMLALIYSPTKDLDLGIAYQRNATNFGSMFSANEPNTSRFQAGVTYRFD